MEQASYLQLTREEFEERIANGRRHLNVHHLGEERELMGTNCLR